MNWSEDPALVVSNALSPAEVQKVIVDSEQKKMDVILTEENLSKAIGRRGQNVRLATKLLNYEIVQMLILKTEVDPVFNMKLEDALLHVLV